MKPNCRKVLIVSHTVSIDSKCKWISAVTKIGISVLNIVLVYFTFTFFAYMYSHVYYM